MSHPRNFPSLFFFFRHFLAFVPVPLFAQLHPSHQKNHNKTMLHGRVVYYMGELRGTCNWSYLKLDCQPLPSLVPDKPVTFLTLFFRTCLLSKYAILYLKSLSKQWILHLKSFYIRNRISDMYLENIFGDFKQERANAWIRRASKWASVWQCERVDCVIVFFMRNQK